MGDKQRKFIEASCKAVPIYAELIHGAEDFYQGVIPYINQKDYMHDLSAIFDGKEYMYYDFCHATDEGNKVIADAIYDCIISLIG